MNGGEMQRVKVITGLLVMITVILTGYVLKVTRFIALPFMFSFFIVMLVYPVQAWLLRRLPGKLRWLSYVLSLLVIVTAFVIFAGGIWLSLSAASEKAPQYIDTVAGYLERLMAWVRSLGLPVGRSMIQSDQVREGFVGIAASVLSSAWSLGAELVFVFFLILLMLIEAQGWKEKVRAAFKERDAVALLDVAGAVAVKVRRYLVLRTAVSAVSGAAAGTWVAIMGVDFALLWGFLTFFLNYIPYLGSIIAIFPPALMALIQHGPFWALITALGLTLIDQTIGNFIEPLLEGKILTISPIIVLVSIIFWGWLWGAAGAILAVPIIITAIIACAHIPALAPFALLLSRTSDARKLDAESHVTPHR